VIHYVGMLEMTIINVIFLTNVEKCFIFLVTQLLPCLEGSLVFMKHSYILYIRSPPDNLSTTV